MLQFISEMPVHVTGIHAVGEVTKEEVEKVLIPRFDEMVAKQGEINYLLIFETDIRNVTLGAWLGDMKAVFKHYTKWNKIAVVTDEKIVIWLSNLFEHFIPGQVRGYPLDKLDEAVIWVSEKEK